MRGGDEGPWVKHGDDRPGMGWNCTIETPTDNPCGYQTICFMARDIVDIDYGHNNAAFIAAARTYLPLLLKIAEAAENIRWQRQAPGCLYEVDEHYVNALRAALDKLKGGK